MNRWLARWNAVVVFSVLSMTAHAQTAYTAVSVNLRAGPAPGYPVVYVVPAGMDLQVQGCLAGYTWCDVVAGPYRGWVYAANIDYAYEGQYVALPSYGPELGITIVGFALLDYWGRFYAHQPFYRDRDRWEHYAPPRPRSAPTWRAPAPGPARAVPPARVEQPPRMQSVPHARPPGEARPVAPQGRRPAQAPRQQPGERAPRGRQGGDHDGGHN